MIGQVFGRLTVISEAGRDKHGKKRYLCLCECGNQTTTTGVYLRNGDTNSCGCFGKEQRIKSRLIHGQSHKTAEYDIWKGMRQRCTNPNHSSYENYGGRGVKVCDRWLNSFADFFEDMGPKPSENHSLDRFPDLNGDYTPTNCRWATDDEQARNKRNNIWLEHNGKRMIMEDWAKELNVDQSTLSELIKTTPFPVLHERYTKRQLYGAH